MATNSVFSNHWKIFRAIFQSLENQCARGDRRLVFRLSLFVPCWETTDDADSADTSRVCRGDGEKVGGFRCGGSYVLVHLLVHANLEPERADR